MLDDLLAPYQTPTVWTPDHVMLRMIWAFDTLRRLRTRVGPAGFGRGWPGYVHEYADLLAQEESQEAEKRRRKYENRDVPLPPTQLDVTLMEEAFQWPLTYLRWSLRLDDKRTLSLMAWAWRRSTNQDAGRHGLAELAHDEATRIARKLQAAGVPVR